MFKNLVLDTPAIFELGDRKHNIAKRTVRGGISTAIAQVCVFTINTVGTAIMARILLPYDYGIVGMSFVVIAFAKMFMEAGLGIITVQEPEITRKGVSNLFWANVAVGLILTAVVSASAPVVSLFYNTPELTAVTIAMSFSFLIGGFGVQHTALLTRHMRFESVAIVQISAMLIDRVVAIALALSGFGYWAVVGGILAASAARATIPMLFCRWIPEWISADVGFVRKIKSGWHVTTANVFVFLTSNFDKIIIGRALGSASLGIYSKAFRLFMLPINEILRPLTNVSVSALSALQDDKPKYNRYVLRLTDLVATLTFPITLFCLVEAGSLIRILLGPNWLDAVSVFRALAIAGFFVPVGGVQGIVLLSLGRSRRYRNYQFGMVLAVVVGVLGGLKWGLNGIAVGYSIATIIVFVPRLMYSLHRTPVRVRDYVGALIKPAGATLLGLLAYLPITISDEVSFVAHAVSTLAFFGIVGLASYRREPIRQIVAFLRSKRPSASGIG